VQDRTKVTINDYKDVAYALSIGVKINNLGWPIRILIQKGRAFGTHHKKWMKIDPYYQRQKCRPLSLVSGDIGFVRIFAGVLWRGGIKRQWGNRKRRFSGILDVYVFGTLENEASIIIQYYLVPCRLSSDPKIYDLECPWRAIWINSVFAPVWLAETARIRKIIAWKL